MHLRPFTRSRTTALLGCLTASVSLGAATACTEGLDLVYEVKDLRVLAIRAEPPEILDTPVPSEVSFEALVVDPRKGPLDYTWSFCPVQSRKACRDYDALIARADDTIEAGLLAGIPDPTVQAAMRDSFGADAIDSAYRIETTPPQQPAQAKELPVVGYSTEPFTVPITALPTFPLPGCAGIEVSDLHLFHAFTQPTQLLSGAWPSAILQVSSGGRELTAAKIVNLTVRDAGGLMDCMGGDDLGIGFRICPIGTDSTPDAPCVKMRVREPNNNPEFVEILYHEGDLANKEFGALPDPLTLQAGESIRLLPTFTKASEEIYETLAANLQTNEIHAREHHEEISVSWFVTAGAVQDALTWVKFTKGLDTVYTAPDTPPDSTAKTVTVWMVARDQRGGTAWRSVNVVIAP